MLAFVGLPIDARRTSVGRKFADRINEHASNPFPSHLFNGKKILQVTRRIDLRRAPMKEKMRQPNQLDQAFGNHGMRRLIGIKKARPRYLGDLRRKRRWP